MFKMIIVTKCAVHENIFYILLLYRLPSQTKLISLIVKNTR